MKKMFIISLGGSLIAPKDIDWQFLKKFKKLIERQIKKGRKFVLIVGGGKIARQYQAAAQKVAGVSSEKNDWLGIQATRLNAYLVKTVFQKKAHPKINTNPHDLAGFSNFKKPILVAAGWQPGFSTDYDAVVLAKNLGVKEVINLSNVSYVYDKDPNRFKGAKKIERISWRDFRKIIGFKWQPGLNAIFDPIASKIAQENNLTVAIMNGRNLKNLENYLNGGRFQGTLIKNE